MKLFLSSLFLLFFLLPEANSQKTKNVELTFVKEHIDLGKVKKGTKRTFDFEFTNTGKEAIKIDIASGCDCTTLDWPRQKILPGQKGKINVVFDSTEKEDSETIDVDLYLENIDPRTNSPYLIIVTYSYELVR